MIGKKNTNFRNVYNKTDMRYPDLNCVEYNRVLIVICLWNISICLLSLFTLFSMTDSKVVLFAVDTLSMY